MAEREIFVPQTETQTGIILPRPEIQRIPPLTFLQENPNPTLEQAFIFLVDNYPQVRNGEAVFEGGFATWRLRPQRKRPADLDWLTTDEEMFEEFNSLREEAVQEALQGKVVLQGAKIFHPRRPVDWFNRRPPLKHTERNERELMESRIPIEFAGRKAWIVNGGTLGFSKAYLYDGHPSRPQDLLDINHLGLSKKDIRRAAHRFGGVPRVALAHIPT